MKKEMDPMKRALGTFLLLALPAAVFAQDNKLFAQVIYPSEIGSRRIRLAFTGSCER
jgi:hypothetical protein